MRLAARRFSLAATAPSSSLRRPVVDTANLARLAQDVRGLSVDEYQLFRSKLSSSFGFPSVSKLLGDLEEKASKIDVNALAAAAAAAVPEPVAAAAAAAPAAPVAAAAKTIFNVKLDSFAAGDKIKIIKVVRELMGLGLKEAKEKVEGAPVVLKEEMGKEDADAWEAKLKAAGAKVVLE